MFPSRPYCGFLQLCASHQTPCLDCQALRMPLPCVQLQCQKTGHAFASEDKAHFKQMRQLGQAKFKGMPTSQPETELPSSTQDAYGTLVSVHFGLNMSCEAQHRMQQTFNQSTLLLIQQQDCIGALHLTPPPDHMALRRLRPSTCKSQDDGISTISFQGMVVDKMMAFEKMNFTLWRRPLEGDQSGSNLRGPDQANPRALRQDFDDKTSASSPTAEEGQKVVLFLDHCRSQEMQGSCYAALCWQ